MSQEQIVEETKARHKENWKKLKGNDFERVDNSYIRAQKRALELEERKFLYHQRNG